MLLTEATKRHEKCHPIETKKLSNKFAQKLLDVVINCITNSIVFSIQDKYHDYVISLARIHCLLLNQVMLKFICFKNLEHNDNSALKIYAQQIIDINLLNLFYLIPTMTENHHNILFENVDALINVNNWSIQCHIKC